MNSIEWIALFFTIAFLASLTGRGGGLLYLSILVHTHGFSTEIRLLSFLLIIATSLPHLPKALKKIKKSMILRLLQPSLAAYLIIGFTGIKASGLIFLVLYFFIGLSSLILLWLPQVFEIKQNKYWQTGTTTMLYSFFASIMSGYIGLSPSLLLVPFLSKALKMDMSETIPFLHFQNLLVITLSLTSTAFTLDIQASSKIWEIAILTTVVLTGSFIGHFFLIPKNERLIKIVFTLLTIFSLVFTLI